MFLGDAIDTASLCANPNMTWDMIQNILSRNEQNKRQGVRDTRGAQAKHWFDWWYTSQNPNITWDIVQVHLDKPWVWVFLSQNANMTWEIIEKHLDKPWVWYYVSKNPNITWDIIRENDTCPWHLVAISQNNNIPCFPCLRTSFGANSWKR